jgi:hypothetical protein
MGYLVFAICNWKGGWTYDFSQNKLIFNCSYTFSNKISYMYIWDIQCTCTHIDIKFLCMMVTETLCVWWWQKHYVYDGDRNIMCMMVTNIMCMMVTETLCVWWWQLYVYDGDRNIMCMMVTETLCVWWWQTLCVSSHVGHLS